MKQRTITIWLTRDVIAKDNWGYPYAGYCIHLSPPTLTDPDIFAEQVWDSDFNFEDICDEGVQKVFGNQLKPGQCVKLSLTFGKPEWVRR